MIGWVRVELGPLQQLADIVIRVGDSWGHSSEAIPAPAGRTRVLVVGCGSAGTAWGALSVTVFVVEGRVTTLHICTRGFVQHPASRPRLHNSIECANA